METAKKYAAKLSGLVLPYLLCGVMLSAALNVYTEETFDIYTAAAAVFAAALFALLEFFRTKKFGGLLYMGAAVLTVNLPRLILGRGLFFDFMQWFFSGGQAVSARAEFMAVFIILFGFFFVSAVFYFTRVVYRSAAVVLVSLIPFALAVKAVTALDWKYPAVIAAINLFMFIYYGRQTSLENAKAAGGSSFMVYADFAVAAALLAMIIPKPADTPFYDEFESAINFLQFGGNGTETVLDGDYSELSGNADALQRGESVLLYFVRTDDPVYYKTQVFDTYDPDVRAWRPSGWVEGDKYWQNAAPLLSFEKLAAAIEMAAEEATWLYEDYPTAKAYEGVAERETYSILYTRDFSAIYVLAPLRIYGAALSNLGAKYSCRSDNGEVFTDLRKLPQSVDYTVRYYSEDIFDELIQRGACDISFEDYGNLLSGVFLYSEFDSEERDIAYEFYNEYRFAKEYKGKTVTPVSEEIQNLADSLTEGLEYDYQKAAAIEAYFQTGGFVYSLGYQAPEELDTPEYFIFESRTGTCSDFATAYTLLARAAGLTVRYAEGFTTSQGQNPQPGFYYIYSENAHAYPEVYIPGAGWRVYEPTVAGGLGENGGADG
ncbi:MAG: DUF3488 and transglutaminase-like domain-containing protein, partial [Muribaculaceae bacterium]|nr:DUF3488 and transglutaminase-like domain-containing protein [Muribaculaceae bacterium]